MSDETPQLFALYKDTLIFRNGFGQEVDGQAIATWIEEDGERWYEVVDCTTPHGELFERAESDIRKAS